MRRIILFLFMVIFLMSGAHALAEENNKGKFDKSLAYDIYFYSHEHHVTVLENAAIVGFEEIGGKQFLVIQPAGFKLEQELGYILFDSVVAILPDRHFRLRPSDKVITFQN